MQVNSSLMKEMGVLADLVYNDIYFSPNPQPITDNRLTSTYTVLKTHNELLGATIPDFFGFQALLLQNNQTAEYVIAFRGTEGWPPTWQSIADIATDGSMAVGNFTQQMEYAIRFVEAARDFTGISADQFTFTGHSLGGSLAEVAGYTFGGQTYTYNPFGVNGVVEGSDYTDFLAEQGLNAVGRTDNIHNIVALGGDDPDFITGVASHVLDSYLGEVSYVKDHSGGNDLGFASHGIGNLNESIAIYNNLLTLFPAEDYNSLTEKFNPITPQTQQVERFLSSLGALGSVHGNTADHVAWSEAIGQSGLTGLTLTGLSASDVSALQAGAASLAGMYALRELLPFTITGADYSHLNQNGELNPDNYSDHYLEDRAEFLYYTMHENTEAIQYDQEGSGIRVAPPSDIHVPARYWFGSAGEDRFFCRPSEIDHREPAWRKAA